MGGGPDVMESKPFLKKNLSWAGQGGGQGLLSFLPTKGKGVVFTASPGEDSRSFPAGDGGVQRGPTCVSEHGRLPPNRDHTWEVRLNSTSVIFSTNFQGHLVCEALTPPLTLTG